MSWKKSDIQTIQATAKKWKAIQIGGGLIALVGVVLAFTGAGTVSLVPAAIGFAVLIVGRIGAWWHHG
jgi:uncharacterized membrane protein HdeD (DUF308 family)